MFTHDLDRGRAGYAFFQGWLAELADILFPRKCMTCGVCFRYRKAPLENGIPAVPKNDYGFGSRMAPFFCPSCREGFIAADTPLCTVCGVVFKSREGLDHVCGACEKKTRYYTRARAAGIYDGPLLWAIRKLKYHGQVGLARPLGQILRDAWLHWWPPDGSAGSIDVILPVPLHPKKLRQRGFNQSVLLIWGWGRTGPGAAPIQDRMPFIDFKTLVRTRHTPPQAALGRSGRRKNLLGAFAVTDPNRIKNRSLLLVDDVMTSGETVEACAATLMEAGAGRVAVLTLARVP